MSPKGIAILENPEPRNHIVYPYNTHAQVAEAVCVFASAGLRKGEAVLLVMSASHADSIRLRLIDEGFNLSELESTGQLVCQDATRLLNDIMFDGIIDDHRFKTAVGGLIWKAKAGSLSGSVRVFGEMVDLIWRSQPRATQRIEELWNEVIEAHSVPLLCAYSLAGTKPGTFPDTLAACHTHAAG